MKASPLQLFPVCNHSRRFAAVGVLAASFLFSRPSLAQYNYIPGTAALNIFFTNSGSAYPGEFDPTPDLISGPCTQVNPSDLNRGAELTSGFFFASAQPGALSGGSYDSGAMVLGTASASVSYFAYPFFVGTNTVSQQTSPTPWLGLINLTNTGPGIAELRLDWTAQFQYTGSTPIAPNANTITGVVLGTWVAVAGGLSFFDVTHPSVSSITIPLAGDYAIYGYPAALSSYSPSGMFWGLETPHTATGTTNTGIYGATGATIAPASGDVIETVGFLDLLVDPGSAQVTIVPAPQPRIQSANRSGTNLLVNLQNCVAGVTYVTLRSTDAAAPLSAWQPVATNIASATGTFAFTATNAVNPSDNAAYFSFQAE